RFAEGQSHRIESISYGKGQGLPNLQANFDNVPVTLRSGDGRLWLPTHSGLAVVHPGRARENPRPVPCLLKQIEVDDRPVAAYGGDVAVHDVVNLQDSSAELRLAPGFHRVKFEFT